MPYQPKTIRIYYYASSLFLLLFFSLVSYFWLPILWGLILIVPLIFLGIYDILQKRSNILRNYPVWGHWRYLLLLMRPQIQAYFIETEWGGKPFSHSQRFLVYNRANQAVDTIPFGTQLDVHAPGYEWVNPSLAPQTPDMETSTRLMIGGPQCKQPYHASRFNISAMSFGALSSEAIRALNRGAKLGHFHHDTGEGGLSCHHLVEGGDLVWEIGTGYFGCRTADGHFDPEKFKQQACHPHVKMLEIKLSQGAKPSHGAILPQAKMTHEIAKARGVPIDQDCISPPTHSAFSTPLELLAFVQQLRDLSEGKPVGFKLCMGIPTEFMAICKAMLKTSIYPDFIVIDGSEGGTGAAPLEFSNYVGMPLNEGLILAYNCLVGAGLKKQIRLIASGKIITGFDLLTKLALGADALNSARGMLFALGCVQSRRCHLNTCPTGITTQDPQRRYAIDVQEKSIRVKHFHAETLKEFLSLLGAAGFNTPEALHPSVIHRRISKEKALTYDQIFTYLNEGDLLHHRAPQAFQENWEAARADTFITYPQPPSTDPTME